MEIIANLMSELINWSDETEKPGEKWADGESGDAIPEKEHDDAALGDGTFFPGDFGMKNVGKNSGESVRNDAI